MGSAVKEEILSRLLLRIDAVMKASSYKYVIFNLLKPSWKRWRQVGE